VNNYFLNKYTAVAIAGQFVAVVSICIVAFAISPVGDRYFGLIFYFYLPAIAVVSSLFGPKGEFGGILLGLPCGIVSYGLIFGLLVSYLKSRRRDS
jgi:hypothetical protein